MKERIAVFAGTFNPFTIGHKSIVERGLKLFDKVIVAVGINPDKVADEAVESRCDAIRRTFEEVVSVEVTTYEGLTAEFVEQVGACAILRGVRNVTDFEYERNLADINLNVLGVETCFLLSKPEYSYISASMVRELQSQGYDVSKYLA